MAQAAHIESILPSSVALVDLSYLFRKNWHAQAPDAEINSAAKRVLEELAAVRDSVEHIIVCCDSPPYFRKQLYPAYKAQREAPSDGMKAAMKWLKERIDADGYQVAAAPTFEADDVIATLALELFELGVQDVRMVGCDKDIAQCVSTGRAMYVPAVGQRPAVVLNYAGVEDKFGVAPVQIPEYLALVGDTSDNLPGIAGIGPKRAAQLLAAYGSLAALYADLESDSDREFKVPIGEKILGELRRNKAQLFQTVELCTLRTDVPLDAAALLGRKEVKPLTGGHVEDEADRINEDYAEEDTPISPPPGLPKLTPLPPKPEAKPAEAIVLHQQPASPAPSWALSLQPTRASDALAVAKTLYNSRLYAKFDNPDQIFAVIMRGRELGIGMTTALDSFSVIKGRPTPSADLIQALCERDPDCEYFMLVESTPDVARYEVKRRSHPKAVPFAYSMADAQKAGLAANDNYKKNPAAMLRARGKSSAGRAMFPGATCGLYCPEEMSE